MLYINIYQIFNTNYLEHMGQLWPMQEFNPAHQHFIEMSNIGAITDNILTAGIIFT